MKQRLKGMGVVIFLGILLGVSSMVMADATNSSNKTSNDAAFKQQIVELSNQISAKIAQIQAKQQLNNEIYPAYKPPLQAELDQLNKELQGLQMKRDQLQSQRTAKDLTQQLKDPQSGTSQGSEKAAN